MTMEGKLCPYALGCAKSNYGNEEICSEDCEACREYFFFNKKNSVTEFLPPRNHSMGDETSQENLPEIEDSGDLEEFFK